MVQALQTRNRKRPAACPKVLRKPACKKPAAKSGIWHLLHSRIWAKTRREENDKHGDDERAKAKASAACKKARVKFLAGELEY